MLELVQGILKGEYHCTFDLLFDWFGIRCMTPDNFCFYLQNRQIQTSHIGGLQYSDTPPFCIPWLVWYLLVVSELFHCYCWCWKTSGWVCFHEKFSAKSMTPNFKRQKSFSTLAWVWERAFPFRCQNWGPMLRHLGMRYEWARHELWMRWVWTFLVFKSPVNKLGTSCEWDKHELRGTTVFL